MWKKKKKSTHNTRVYVFIEKISDFYKYFKLELYRTNTNILIYVCIYVCVCVCEWGRRHPHRHRGVCVCTFVCYLASVGP